jgi:hypothetical protein
VNARPSTHGSWRRCEAFESIVTRQVVIEIIDLVPYIASTIAPQFAPPGTTIEGALASKVVGTGVYTFWNDMLYLEASAYQNLSRQALETLGEPGIGNLSIGGGDQPR